VPDITALMPHLDDLCRDEVEDRGIPPLESISYPLHAPITARPDWRRRDGVAAGSVAEVGAVCHARHDRHKTKEVSAQPAQKPPHQMSGNRSTAESGGSSPHTTNQLASTVCPPTRWIVASW
jgi:hypothetical protein